MLLGIPRLNPGYATSIHLPVHVLFLSNNRGEWNSSLIHDMFIPEDTQSILSWRPPTPARHDKYMWYPSRTGKFSAKSSYKQLCKNASHFQPSLINWKLWWKVKIPRLLLLGSKIASNCLPTPHSSWKQRLYFLWQCTGIYHSSLLLLWHYEESLIPHSWL